MQYSKLAIFAAVLAPFASAQLSALPSCALNPAIAALGSTTCGTDIKCACSDSAFINSLTPAIRKSCTAPGDLQKAITAAINLCASVGVTLTIPGDSATSVAPASPTAAPPASTPAAPVSSAAPATTAAPLSSTYAVPATSAKATTAAPSTTVVVAKSSMTTSYCPSTVSSHPSASANGTTVSVTAPTSTLALSSGAGAVQAMGFVAAAVAVMGYLAL